jgi:hypothetical protein
MIARRGCTPQPFAYWSKSPHDPRTLNYFEATSPPWSFSGSGRCISPLVVNVAALTLVHSPQHSVTDTQCRQYAFQICQDIAHQSDPGRKALIENGALPVLRELADGSVGKDAVKACNILEALAHTGTYRHALISAKVQDLMRGITG